MTYLQKYAFPVKQKKNFKVFNMIKNNNEAKIIVKKYVIVKANSMLQLRIQIQVQKVSYVQKHYSWNLATCICENSKHLKRVVDDSVIACDEFIYVVDIISTNSTNTMFQQILIVKK